MVIWGAEFFVRLIFLRMIFSFLFSSLESKVECWMVLVSMFRLMLKKWLDIIIW